VELELRQLFRYARHWWWLLILGPLIAGGAAYFAASRQQPLYSASATLQVNPPQTSGSIDFSALQGSKSLAETYRQLITTGTVLAPVVDTLKLPYNVDALEGKVSASTVGDTQLIRVSVSDTNPERAAAIANAIASQFVAHTQARSADLISPYRTTLDQQISQVSTDIKAAQSRIQQLEAKGTDTTADEKDELQQLNAQLDQLQASYRDLIVAANEMDRASAAAQTQVTIEDPATAPDTPYAPRTMLYTVLGAFVGLCIAVGGVGLLEYLDNTVKANTDFQELFGVPLLSVVGTVPKIKNANEQLFVSEQPKSSAAEAIRLLRTNLEFAAAIREITTIAITSAGPGEGKSTVTANLGVTMAQAGFSTVIVDADLRKPSQHRIWGFENDRGLSTLLTHPNHPWNWVAMREVRTNLAVITSGPVPPNPADLLSTDRFRDLIKEIGRSVDIVIVDTPPALAVSDPLVIATSVDAVAVVAVANRTRIDALRQAIANLSKGPVRIIGVVVNRNTGRAGEGYYYYGDYYGQPEDMKPRPPTVPPTNLGTRDAASPSGSD